MTFTDPRDGETYKTVKINGKIWLAENFRYQGPYQKFNDWKIGEKGFYYYPNGERKNTKKYGYLYTWKNAFRACPKGWRLPTREEIKALAKLGSTTLIDIPWNISSNSSGFSARMAGSCLSGHYHDFGGFAWFWSATEHESGSNHAYNLYLGGFSDASVECFPKDLAFSVRCIKD